MSQNETDLSMRGKAGLHVTKWNYPDGHNHPSAGIINPRQQILLSNIKTASLVSKKVAQIMSRLNKPVLDETGQPITVKTGEETKYKWTAAGIEKFVFDEHGQLIQDADLTRAMCDEAFMDGLAEYCDWVNDYSISIGGVGRLGANKAIGRFQGQEEDSANERGRIARFFLGPKKSEYEKAL
jgi:hypothetical protein